MIGLPLNNSSLVAGAVARTSDLAADRNQRRAEPRRFALAVLALDLGLVVSVGLATGIGRMPVGWKSVVFVILGQLGLQVPTLDRTTEVVVWGIRLHPEAWEKRP